MSDYNYFSAPIVPYVGIGCFKLYDTVAELDNIRKHLANNDYIKYNDDERLAHTYETAYLYLYYHRGNKKLWRITTKPTFKGKLNDNIYVGADLNKAIASLEDVRYDDQEVYESEKTGVFFEPDDRLAYISIYIKELYCDDFWDGKW